MNSPNNPTETVNVRILDKEYTIGVPSEERANLIDAAKALDVRMREIRNANRIASTEQVAVLVALHLAHELETQNTTIFKNSQQLNYALDALELQMDSLEKS